MKRKRLFIPIIICVFTFTLIIGNILGSNDYKKYVSRSFEKNFDLLDSIVIFAKTTEGDLRINYSKNESSITSVDINQNAVKDFNSEKALELVKQLKSSTVFNKVEEHNGDVWFYSKKDDAIDFGVVYCKDISSLGEEGYEKIRDNWYYFFFGYT